MEIRLEFLRERLDEVAFVELKTDLKIGERVALKQGIPLPVTVRTLRDKVTENPDAIRQEEFIRGILFLMGLDPKFAHGDAYRSLMEALSPDWPMVLSSRLFEGLRPDNRIETLIQLVGMVHLGFDHESMLIQIGRLSLDIYLDTLRKDYESLAYRIFAYLTKHETLQPLPYFHLGYEAYNAGRFHRAQQLWETSLEKGLGEAEQAALVEIFPELRNRIVYEDGVGLILKGRAREGVERLMTLREIFSEWWNLMFFIGLGLRMDEEYSKALHYFERALELNPDEADILNEMGICHTMNGDYDQAVDALEKALEREPENHEILCNLGIAHEQAGRRDQARHYISRAYLIAPDDPITGQWMTQLKIK